MLKSSNQPFKILGLGHACIDLVVAVSEDFIKEISGNKGGAQAIDLEELNMLLRLIPQTPKFIAGGSAANTIKGLAALGENCTFLTHLGKDHLADYFSKHLQTMGITLLASASEDQTSQVLCLVTPDKQRTMRFYSGCSHEFSEGMLHPNSFQEIKHLHLEAYLLRNGNLPERAMQLAKKNGATVSIDLSSFEIVHEFKSQIIKLLQGYVDIVFANEDELQALLSLSAYEGCLALKKKVPIAVILMGKKGCLVGSKDQILHHPANLVTVVDTTGAGDLFASGFLYGFLHHYPLTECAILGNRLGGAIVQVEGAELPPDVIVKSSPSRRF